MIYILSSLILLLCIAENRNINNLWSYQDQNYWKSQFPNCGLRKQSPVDFSALERQYGTNPLSSVVVPTTYNGIFRKTHQDLLIMPANNSETFEITHRDGITYEFVQLHFHTSCARNQKGTEHEIDENFFDLEVHFVFKQKDISFDEAVKLPNGLSVLGFLYQEANSTQNTFLQYFIDNINATTDENITVMFNRFAMDFEKFITVSSGKVYRGSLTTPPCHEAVRWTVFYEVIPIPKDLLSTFKELAVVTKPKLCDNIRLTQRFI